MVIASYSHFLDTSPLHLKRWPKNTTPQVVTWGEGKVEMIKLRQPLQGCRYPKKRNQLISSSARRFHLSPPKQKKNWPSRKLTYPTGGQKENHRLKSAILGGYVIVPWRVYSFNQGGKVNNQQDLK